MPLLNTQFAKLVSTIGDIYVALKYFINQAVRPGWLNPGANALRVTQVSSTGAVDTLNTVTSLTRLDGFDAKETILNSLDRSLWYQGPRRCIT
ncbi:MAG: hypothetical protein HY790_14865 [Deltaproteobacteria bacterium]|nr:hypothetical protein [Deltaproteobacteria bacterium]MBI4797094.1 hypothetical protein [Deltaproteobacteria bacterium]